MGYPLICIYFTVSIILYVERKFIKKLFLKQYDEQFASFVMGMTILIWPIMFIIFACNLFIDLLVKFLFYIGKSK